MQPTTREQTSRTALRELAVLLLFAALTVLMTWPLAANLERAISDPGDPFFSTWVIDWGYHATVTPNRLFDANILHPARRSLAFSEHTYGITLLLLPLFAAGVAPLTIHNIAILLGFALSGYTTYLLARWLTRSTTAAVIGGIAFAFIGYRFHHLGHLPYVWTFWMPVMLLAAMAYGRRPSWKRAALFGVATLFNGLTSITYFVFATPAALLVLIFLGLQSRTLMQRRFWLPIATALLAVAIAMTPFLLPYRALAKEYGMERTVQEVLPNGAQWRDWLTPNLQNRNYGALSPRASYNHERTLFPGFVILALFASSLLFIRRRDLSDGAETESLTRSLQPRTVAALDVAIALFAIAALGGLVAGRVRIGSLSYTGAGTALFVALALLVLRLWLRAGERPLSERIRRSRFPADVWGVLVVLAIGVLGARGLNGFFHTFLFDHLSAYRGIRMPIRWAILAYLALSVLAAIGMLPLLRSRSRVIRATIGIAVAGLLLFELRAAPIRYYLVADDPRPVYEWIRDTPIAGAVVELPLTQSNAYEYVWRSTVHHKPLVNGVSSFMPPAYEELANLYAQDPIPELLFDRLEAIRTSVVVVHAGALREREGAVRDWLGRGVASGRLSFVRHFAAGARGDWAFAMNRVEPFAVRWRVPEVADLAGRTPLQSAERFLAGDPWIPTAAPFVFMNAAPVGTLRGPQEFAGWASAEAGVAAVFIRLANGRLSQPAELHDRPDVRQVMPWASPASMRGFSAKVTRPRFIDGETDLQVEVVDANGRRTLMPPMLFVWRDTVPVTVSWDVGRLRELLTRLGADADRDADRMLAGTAAIADFAGELHGDADRETDLAFVERVLPILLGEAPSPATTSRFLNLIARGTSRERVIEAIIDSREFRDATRTRRADGY